MPGKKKQAKKKEAKPNAAKGGKGSPGKAKAAKAAPAGAKAGNGAAAPQVKPKDSPKPIGREKAKLKTDLAPLKMRAEEARKGLTKAENEANALRAQAKTTGAVAKKAYIKALAPYRDACRKAGVKCEFTGSRAQNVAPAVRFLVERVKGGVKVMIKDKPKTEQVITDAALKKSIGKAAFAYTDRWLGSRDTIGAKGAGLSNRFRAALKAK